MPFIEMFAKKKIWIATGVVWCALLLAWAVGAALIEKGVVPLHMQRTWIGISSLGAGLLGGSLVSKKNAGTLMSSLGLACLISVLYCLLSWILLGGIDFREDGWKSMVMLLLGCLISGFLCAKKRSGTGARRKKFTPRRVKKR